ncbi:MAG TPA: cupin domain-containing protein [Steroidobacteraceae bacterium]|nr:cupin domain-containing protein [Steroidobacteraceae bacterium]
MDSNIYPLKQASPDESDVTRWVLEHLAGGLACGRELNSRGGKLLARVLGALPPPGTRTVRAGSGAWVELTPGVTINLLRIDRAADNVTAYVRMQPGAAYPAHRHAQTEECLVIEGEIIIGSHCLRAGDMHVAACGTEHGMVSSPRGALMLVSCRSY